MVNGILTIPLSGAARGGASTEPGPHRLAEFVAGSENSLAAAALAPFLAHAVTTYSPLVLYGPHGAGKSHLSQGLVDWWRRHSPLDRVQSCTAAEFAQQYAAALAESRLEAWREELRSCQLLVIEDLQQMSGKRGAQQELLHTLEALVDAQAWIVVTARSLPLHWPALLAGLRSRLSAGLCVPLALPARATRRAILERLAKARGVPLPKRAIDGLADGIQGGVPALLSAIMELEFAAQHDGSVLDTKRVQQLVAARTADKAPTLREIAGLTAKYFGLKLADLKSPLRQRALVAARGVAMYLARQLTKNSLEQIGAFFGGRDHTTVLHGYRRMEKLVRQDRAMREAVGELKKLLQPS